VLTNVISSREITDRQDDTLAAVATMVGAMVLRGLAAMAAFLLGSCATQPPYQGPAIPVASEWSNSPPNASQALSSYPESERAGWWSRLDDRAINTLVEAALADNPTLAQVAATVDEARATLRINRAQRIPQVGFSSTATHSFAANPQLSGGSAAFAENSVVFGPGLAWEVDLWGRVRESVQAARDRLDARSADAEEARLSLIAQIADTVLSLRACGYSLTIRDRDIASRETELALTRERLARGNVAPVDEANAATDLASARTDRISQAEQCTRDVDILVALSGREAAEVRALVGQSLLVGNPVSQADSGRAPPPIEDANPAALMPTPPPRQLAVPATVLLTHPVIVSAEREVAARWSQIAVARADRLPKVRRSAGTN
jgi:outer membrane protein TolC